MGSYSATLTVKLDKEKLEQAVQDADGLPPVLGDAVQKVLANANMLSSGFRTGIYHDHRTGETLGDTQPEYGGDVARKGRSMVGIVHPRNYAAMKDNYENNTMLKALR